MLKIDAIRDNTVYIIGDEKLITKDEYLSSITEDGDCRLFVRKTNIEGIFLYGSEQLCEYWMGHEKGYVWSSRASVMNKEFDIALIEARYKVESATSYSYCAIDLVIFEQLLKEAGYEVMWTPIKNTEYDLQYGLKKLSNA